MPQTGNTNDPAFGVLEMNGFPPTSPPGLFLLILGGFDSVGKNPGWLHLFIFLFILFFLSTDKLSGIKNAGVTSTDVRDGIYSRTSKEKQGKKEGRKKKKDTSPT